MPAQSIDNFINTFNNMGGAQKSNNYVVYITPPKDLLGFHPEANVTTLNKDLSTILNDNQDANQKYMASSVQIPAGIVEYYQSLAAPSGNYVDIPVKRQFDKMFKIEFLVDRNWYIRSFFEDWMDLIFNRNKKTENRNNITVSYYDNIVGTVRIDALNVNGDKAKSIFLYGAYPTTVIPSATSYDAFNNYLTLQVDMNYRYYDVEFQYPKDPNE